MLNPVLLTIKYVLNRYGINIAVIISIILFFLITCPMVVLSCSLGWMFSLQ